MTSEINANEGRAIFRQLGYVLSDWTSEHVRWEEIEGSQHVRANFRDWLLRFYPLCGLDHTWLSQTRWLLAMTIAATLDNHDDEQYGLDASPADIRARLVEVRTDSLREALEDLLGTQLHHELVDASIKTPSPADMTQLHRVANHLASSDYWDEPDGDFGQAVVDAVNAARATTQTEPRFDPIGVLVLQWVLVLFPSDIDAENTVRRQLMASASA